MKSFKIDVRSLGSDPKVKQLLVNKLHELGYCGMKKHGCFYDWWDAEGKYEDFHKVAPEAWNYQQEKMEFVLKSIEEFEKNTSEDKRLLMSDLFKEIKEVLK